MAKQNVARFVALGMLSHEPMSGYDMKKRVSMTMGNFWDLSYGQIYPALKELEAGGLVTRRVEHRRAGPSRKVYTITPAGLEALREWLKRPVAAETHRYELLLKLFFGAHVDRATNMRRIREFRERNAASVGMMGAFEADLNAHLGESEDHPYILLTVLLGKEVYSAHVRWADAAIAMLKAGTRGR